jgi:hypothetical protein
LREDFVFSAMKVELPDRSIDEEEEKRAKGLGNLKFKNELAWAVTSGVSRQYIAALERMAAVYSHIFGTSMQRLDY